LQAVFSKKSKELAMEIKPFLAVLFAGALILFLCACGKEPEPISDETSDITVPTLDQSQTPGQLLSTAAAKTRSLEAFSIDYVRNRGEDRFALSGQIRADGSGGYRAQTLTCNFNPDGTTVNEVARYYQGSLCYEQLPDGVQQWEGDAPYDLAQILPDLAEFQNRQDLIAAFSSLPMNVIPSYDGSFLYQLENLTQDELSTLLYGNINADLPEGSYTAAITVAPEGYLSSLEFTGTDFQVCLTITSNDRGTEPSI
jgi:hypothetical protein